MARVGECRVVAGDTRSPEALRRVLTGVGATLLVVAVALSWSQMGSAWRRQETATGRPPVIRTSSSNVVGNTGAGAPRRPSLLVLAQRDVHEGGERGGVTDWRHPADREAGALAHQVRVGALEPLDPEERRDGAGVDPVGAGGHHQHRGAATAVAVRDGEHQRVGDLGDRHAELLGGGHRSPRVLVEHDHLAGRTGGGEG